jgi:PQQ-dependent dehydrogenase (methanol/ethanol family)
MGRRLGLWLILAAGSAFIALLATGVLSEGTGGNNAATLTIPPLAPTTPEPVPAAVANPFGPGDWGTYGGGFDQIRHSPLTQVNEQNVSQLGRVFAINFRQLDQAIPPGQESFPVVVNGTIYVTTGNDYVFAIDGSSGRVLWQYRPSSTGVYSDYGVNTNRGVAYCNGEVFLLTLDMHIVALDANSGRVLTDVPIARAVPGASAEFGYSETSAPICYDNILLIGASGSDYGVRGFVMAYHTDLTPAWSSPYWTIPPAGEGWRQAGSFVGGGTNWNPATIDPTTNLMYITTSTPAPIFDPQARPGPDPRTDSVVALNLFTGRQVWWQQQLSGDQWGYSTSQPVLVFTADHGGHRERVVAVGTKEGMWFMYNALTGAPIYAHVNLLNTNEHPSLKPGRPVTVYPSSLGGLNYSPSSFDPATGYVVNSQAETAAALQERTNATALNESKVQGDVDNGLANSSFGQTPPGWHDYGSVSAVDTRTGSIAWKFITAEPGRGGVTTTNSGLGFAGGGNGDLQAFDTKTGEVLWTFQTGNQIAAGPTIYEAHGVEYVAIAIGGTPSSSFGGTASILDVFALHGNRNQSPAPALIPRNQAPGVLNQPSEYLSTAPAPHTLELTAVASPDAGGRPSLDGSRDGEMIVRVPAGWTLDVTFANDSGTNGDGLAVTSGAGSAAPVFTGAQTPGGPDGVPAAGASYFHFTATRVGSFALASTASGRAAGGEWIQLEITPPTETPELVVGGTTYAVIVTSGGGGGGGGLGQ